MSDTKQGPQPDLQTLTRTRDDFGLAIEAHVLARTAHDVLGISASTDLQKKGLMGRMSTMEDTVRRIERGYHIIMVSFVLIALQAGIAVWDRVRDTAHGQGQEQSAGK